MRKNLLMKIGFVLPVDGASCVFITFGSGNDARFYCREA